MRTVSIGFAEEGFALLGLRRLAEALIRSLYQKGRVIVFFGALRGGYPLDTCPALSSSKIGRLGATLNRGG